MAMSPQRVRETTFRSARRGYEPSEVDAFVQDVAGALETAQNEATAMEARARAAVARLQELSQSQPAAEPTPTAAPGHVEEAETISRTLLLAQRTADQTVAEAQEEAERVRVAAGTEAAEIIEEAKHDATRDGEAERVRVDGEVQELIARRDFLESDVEHLEQFIMAQRERIVEATSELQALCQRVPSGLGDMRRPLLSAASAPPGADGDHQITETNRVAEAEQAHAAAADGADVSEGDGTEDEGLPPPDREQVVNRP